MDGEKGRGNFAPTVIFKNRRMFHCCYCAEAATDAVFSIVHDQ